MGTAMQVVSGAVVNPGAAITAITPNTGDTFAVRNFDNNARAWLEQMWAQEATAGVFRIRSPRLHDAAQGIRIQPAATPPRLELTSKFAQPLYPGDVLVCELSGGAAETDVGAFLAYYEDLPGVAARLAMPDEIAPRVANILGVEVDVNTGAALGNYGGAVNIVSAFNNIKADTDYAVLGYTTSVSVGVVGITGPDTGNLRVGGPGAADDIQTRDYFSELSLQSGRPHIPVINGTNAQATVLDLVHTAAAVAVRVSLNLAELRAA